MICGFPGETEAHHEDMLRWTERMRFERVGCFTYSHEENTHAYTLNDDVSEEVKKKRVDEIMTANVQTVFEEMPIEEALSLMRSQTVRRLIVVARDGALVGIVSLDDVLALLAEEFRDVGKLLERESPRVAAAAS